MLVNLWAQYWDDTEARDGLVGRKRRTCLKQRGADSGGNRAWAWAREILRPPCLCKKLERAGSLAWVCSTPLGLSIENVLR